MFGISTHCLSRVPLEEALERLLPLTSYVEVMADGMHMVTDPSLLESYPFMYSFHAPARGVNIASQLEPIRKASVEVTKQCMETAAEADAVMVVVHPGYYAWPEMKDAAEERLTQSLSELSAFSKEVSVNFSIENMGDWDYFFLRTPVDMELIDGFGFALDVGHANQNKCLDDFLKYDTCHYHLHDNDGIRDSHAAIGDGNIDFGAVFEAVKASGVAPILEVESFEGTLRSIPILEKNLK